MKKTLYGTLAFMVVLTTSQAANYLTVDFGVGYTAGNLAGLAANAAGQNDWKQSGSSATTPIQINSSGQAVIGATGQDIYKAFTTPFTKTDGNSIYFKSRVAITGATTAGDYLLHLGSSAGGTEFLGRISAKLTATGASTFQLGIQSLSGAGSAFTYGTTNLDLNTFYDVVMKWDFVAGALNDTFSVYVNPSSNVLANLTPYVSAGWLTSVAEPAALATVNLRQGSNTTALVSSLSVGDSLTDVGVIPEPSSSVLMVLGAVGLIGLRAFGRKQS